jgi:hypothetical protein
LAQNDEAIAPFCVDESALREGIEPSVHRPEAVSRPEARGVPDDVGEVLQRRVTGEVVLVEGLAAGAE